MCRCFCLHELMPNLPVLIPNSGHGFCHTMGSSRHRTFRPMNLSDLISPPKPDNLVCQSSAELLQTPAAARGFMWLNEWSNVTPGTSSSFFSEQSPPADRDVWAQICLNKDNSWKTFLGALLPLLIRDLADVCRLILPPQLPQNFRICSLSFFFFFRCQPAKYFKHFPLTNVSLWGKVH